MTEHAHVHDIAQERAETLQAHASHQDTVDAVRAQLISQPWTEAMAELFKVFGDPGRLRILQALSVQELHVCCLAEALNTSDSAISHQLRILKQARLVRGRREGKRMYYSLDDDHINEILHCGMEHVHETPDHME